MMIGYDRLVLGEKKQYDKLYHAILNGDSAVTFFGVFKIDALKRIIMAIKYEHVELFYIDFQRINYVVSPVGLIYYIHYISNPTNKMIMNQKMENWIAEAVEKMQITGQETEADIYRKAHNYLIRNIEYDYDALQNPNTYPESFTIQGVFERRRAVCEGISKAFKLLCSRAGAGNVYIIEGISSKEGFGSSIPHAWNVVKSGTDYSYIDVTWDLSSSKVCKHNRYDYFMIPDEWLKNDHIYESCFACRTCNQTYFVQQKSLISGTKSLKKFVEQKLQQKNLYLYFKIIGKNGIPNNIDNKIQDLVLNIVRQYARGSYSLEMTPNKAQHIYFYKINY